jgi:hypothetical protein
MEVMEMETEVHKIKKARIQMERLKMLKRKMGKNQKKTRNHTEKIMKK